MALEYPWAAFDAAQQRKQQNRQQMYQDIAGLGQGLGEGFNTIGQAMQAKKQKDQWQKTINELMNNPNANPQLKAMLPMIAQRPELMGQIGPELLKLGNPQKIPNVWRSAGLDKNNHPLEINEQTGEYRTAPLEAKPGGMGAAMAGERHSQFGITQLPSNQSPTTAGGAAYQVKVAARQGKAIIGKPGSPQQLALAASDLARAVQRSAPQLDTLQGAGFSDNLQTTLNRLVQRVTADPHGKDVPKIRRQIYDLLDDLDKTATPWIENQLETLQEGGYPISELQRKRQLGLNIADVPFIDGINNGNTNTSSWDPSNETRLQELLRKKQNGTIGK